MAEQGKSQKPIARRSKDERAPVRLDEVRDPAGPIGRSEHCERSYGQRDMHAVELERALETAASHWLEAILKRPRQVNEADRQTGQKNKGFGAVREAEVPRRPIFERVAGNVVDQDRDQH